VSPPPDVDGGLSPIVKRYADRRRELEEATANKVATAEEAGRVLAMAGDLLRRTEAVGDAARDAMLAIDRIESQAVNAYVESVDAAAERAKLARGIDDAFEAMIAGDDEADERVLYAESAEAALAARDALASVRAALAHGGADTGKLDEKLAAIDAGLAKQARLLVGLNGARRRELEALDPGEREAAWWFAARARCDFLVSLYRSNPERTRADAGQVTAPHNAAHLAVCEDCQRDVEASSLAYTPQHLTASSLWRREHGEATASEITFMDAHAKSCKDCQRALDALAVAEE
jgi:hypothetical protein